MYTGKFLKELMLANNKSLTRSSKLIGVPAEALSEYFKKPEIEDAVMIDFCTKIGLPFPAPYSVIHSLLSLMGYLNFYKKTFEKLLNDLPRATRNIYIQKIADNKSLYTSREEDFRKVIEDVKTDLAKLSLRMPDDLLEDLIKV